MLPDVAVLITSASMLEPKVLSSPTSKKPEKGLSDAADDGETWSPPPSPPLNKPVAGETCR